jgi:hypothetical protein
LNLGIAPSGGRWWRFKYRFAGKEKRISLGVYPYVGLKESRERLDELRKLVAAGIDPAEQRKAASFGRSPTRSTALNALNRVKCLRPNSKNRVSPLVW